MNTKGSDALAQKLKTVDHQDAADKLGVTRACLYTWRRGRGTPRTSNRVAMERLLGIPRLDWFVPVEVAR
jgi:hypothetical protein